MRPNLKNILPLLLLLGFLLGQFPSGNARAADLNRRLNAVTAYDLILAMNTLRVSLGNQALVEDPIINAVAQATAETMAANQLSWHIGNVSGRIQAAGFGGGAKVWATENFAVGSNHTIDSIMQVWADDSHMIPARNPAYCAVGAGVAQASNGMTYYVLQAAYTSGMQCGEYVPMPRATLAPGETPQTGSLGVSQIIVPVKISTPDADGKTFHEVKAGQSLWAIAIAYNVTIKDLEVWNNIRKEDGIQMGQKLFIPNANTAGYATPTPVGMVVTATPEADGRIVHIVQAYNTLSTIAAAYKVDMAGLLALNGISEDTPLQIGQKLLVRAALVTPSPTPLPLTPLQRLTPESDGRYYHIVKPGDTLSGIAAMYEVKVADLMAWNAITDASLIRVDQKILLLVTPPVSPTPTSPPPTRTPSPTAPPPTATPTINIPRLSPTPTPVPVNDNLPPLGLAILGVGVVGLGLLLLGRLRH